MKPFALLLFLMLLIPAVQAGQVRVAVASNFLSTLKDIAVEYEALSGNRLIISAASTGKLYAQIVNGAPFDVFLAADRQHLLRLADSNLLLPESRFIYATGQLVLWRARPEPVHVDMLRSVRLKHLAMANPRTAPYGLAARQTLQALGLWSSLKARRVTGENINQAFQFVASGNAELGFVALSQVKSPLNRFNKRHYWLVPQDYYQPLTHEAGLLSRARAKPAAQDFLDYLQHDEGARRVIQRYGYH